MSALSLLPITLFKIVSFNLVQSKKAVNITELVLKVKDTER